MSLKGIPKTITPELIYALAKMGHGDTLVITDSNFPSDSTAAHTVNKVPIRVTGSTSDILRDILTLIPLDPYSPSPVCVMDRVGSDKEKGLEVIAYKNIAAVIDQESQSDLYATDIRFELTYVERFDFYGLAREAFCVVQTTDCLPYANILISKGVL